MKKLFCLFIALVFSSGLLFAEEEAEKEDVESSKTTIYESSNDLLDETENSENIGFSFLAKTLKFVKKIPFDFIVGMEGAANGTNTYVSADYAWTPAIHTRLNFEYQHSLLYEKGDFYNEEIQLSPLNYYSFQLFPVEYHVFFNKKHTSQFTCTLGVQYLHSNQDTEITGWKSELVSSEKGDSTKELLDYKYKNHTDNYLVGPLARFYFRIPLNSFIVFNSETLVNPINAYFTDSSANYYLFSADDVKSNSNTFNNFNWTFTEVKQTCHLDLFNLFAVVANYSFRNTENNYFDLYNVNLPISNTNFDQHIFKVGVSLVATGKTVVRLKSGIYYEHKWSKNNITNIKTYEGNWAIALGLYL